MRILGVGAATIDIVNLVESYPAEDSEVRAVEQRICRGGNAANTLVVLSQLGHVCSFCGVIADTPDSAHIVDDLGRFGVDMRYLLRRPGGSNPTSYVTLSRRTGSRSIVHYRRLPEYRPMDFVAVDLSRFDWVHFEGRDPEQLEPMLRRLAASPGIGCSLEVEKARPGIEALFSYPRLLMFSRGYARSTGYGQATDLLLQMGDSLRPDAQATCAWGDRGAWGLDAAGLIHHAPARSPARLVDTLGAGDVFNAGVIHGLAAGRQMPQLLRDACRLAGKKCGVPGLEGLSDGEKE